LGAPPPELAVNIRMTEQTLAIRVGLLCDFGWRSLCRLRQRDYGRSPAAASLARFCDQHFASSTTVSQGATSSGMQVSIQALNGFSGDVQMTLSGIPSGVTANPLSPFSIPSGGSATLLCVHGRGHSTLRPSFLAIHHN
jgi:hypothetical protein